MAITLTTRSCAAHDKEKSVSTVLCAHFRTTYQGPMEHSPVRVERTLQFGSFRQLETVSKMISGLVTFSHKRNVAELKSGCAATIVVGST